jgi:hypothetical protein
MSYEDHLTDWYPTKLIKEADGQLSLRWHYINRPFSEPFFEESILKCLSHPFNSKGFKTVTCIESFKEFAENITDQVPPAAFIFHISRCGSTLLSQLLTASEQNIVLSEMPLLDEILRSGKTDQNLLISLLRIFGKKRSGKEMNLFVKLDSWHLLYYEILKEIFPDVPIIILFRNPAEVLESHRKLKGIQTIPGFIDPALLRLEKETIQNKLPEKYFELVLEKYFEQIVTIKQKETKALLINYNNGFENVIENISEYLSISFPVGDLLKMKERFKFHSKKPEVVFQEERITLKPNSVLQDLYLKISGMS